jgi:ubiquinone/menaquinone biosynthesis C-methylase UbiE
MEYPNDIVTAGSKALWDKGVRVLQSNRFDPSEREHVLKLALHMKLNGEREVADMGCGFGEVSRILSELLPDAHFRLVNINGFQLNRCPEGERFTPHAEDFACTTIPDNSVDLVMFNYAICHAPRPVSALQEAARIVRRPNGRLFVYDYERIGGDNGITEAVLSAQFHSETWFKLMCNIAGWRYVRKYPAVGDDTQMREALGNDGLYDMIFSELRPVIWRAHI